MCAEERPTPEDEVPRLRLKIISDRGAPCDPSEVRQPHIPSCGRLRVNTLANPGMHAVSADDQVCAEHGAVGQGRLDMVAGIGHFCHPSPSSYDDAPALRLALKPARQQGAFHGQCEKSVLERTPQTHRAQPAPRRAVHDIRARWDTPFLGRREGVDRLEGV